MNNQLIRIKAMILLCFSMNVAQAEVVPVFLAGGQSNAKIQWANAIETELRAIYHPKAEVVHSFHPGDWLGQWSSDGVPQGNFTEDSAKVAITMESIREAGDTPVFRGIFWFQGEGDTGSSVSIGLYKNRFRDMVSWYQLEYGESPCVCIMVIDAILPWAGRNQQNVDAMRQVLMDIGEPRPNVSRVDTRGYERSDPVHLTIPALEVLGVNAARAFTYTYGPRERRRGLWRYLFRINGVRN